MWAGTTSVIGDLTIPPSTALQVSNVVSTPSVLFYYSHRLLFLFGIFSSLPPLDVSGTLSMASSSSLLLLGNATLLLSELVLAPSSSIRFNVSSMDELVPISVMNCMSLRSSGSSLDITVTDIQPGTYTLLNYRCKTGGFEFMKITPKVQDCRQYSVTPSVSSTKLQVLISVNSNACNRSGISDATLIAIIVVGAAIVIVVLVVVIVTVRKNRKRKAEMKKLDERLKQGESYTPSTAPSSPPPSSFSPSPPSPFSPSPSPPSGFGARNRDAVEMHAYSSSPSYPPQNGITATEYHGNSSQRQAYGPNQNVQYSHNSSYDNRNSSNNQGVGTNVNHLPPPPPLNRFGY